MMREDLPAKHQLVTSRAASTALAALIVADAILYVQWCTTHRTASCCLLRVDRSASKYIYNVV